MTFVSIDSLSRRRGWRALGLGTFSLLLSTPALAQTPAVVLSTSQDVSGTDFTDGDMVFAGGGGAPQMHLSSGHFLAMAGFVPSDVDAYAHQPGVSEDSASALAFSLLSDQAGFLDGDVLELDSSGGTRVLLSEADLATALGVPGANIDVDAVDFDDQSRLLFSLQADVAGTVLGDVSDGDVLRLAVSGVVEVVMLEQDVQACYTAVTGLQTAINDVQAIDWVNGELWVAFQSPSAFDGAVLSCGATPAWVLEEDDIGLGGAEINALSYRDGGGGRPFLAGSPGQSSASGTLDFEFRGTPNSTCIVFMAGNAGAFGSRFGGLGRWYFDRNDPWLTSILASRPLPLVHLDGNGLAQVSFPLPPVPVSGLGHGGESGWSFQLIELGTRRISAPWRAEEI